MTLAEAVLRRGDAALAAGLLVLLGVMLVPLPPLALDLFLSVSLALSVVILVVSVYVERPLDFSVFPSVLLITTLFRLGLNVASTKLILLRGDEGTQAAGRVIQAFGHFVVGGNYVVGFVVFLILVVVNFVVVTKGAGRIAEVAARFTLDAMPGKQMAIDADLNAGLIGEAEARARRREVAREADFYGAMDGASKFVRGDAVAGLVITGINILGGFAVGVLQKGMPAAEAAQTYTVLTIGDGLVAQIPALLVSTAAGIVVTRTGAAADMGREITRQVVVNPKALAAAAGILAVLGAVPGLPHLPLLLMAAAAGGLAYAVSRKAAPAEAPPAPEPARDEPRPETFLELNPLAVEIGYGLIPLVDGPGGDLLQKVRATRRQVARELGFVVPPVHIRDNLQLRPHEYSILVRGVEAARGELMMGYWLAIGQGRGERVDGIPTKEPAFGLPAWWVEESQVERAQLAGCMVADPATVLATHLTETIRRHAAEILTRSEVQSLLDSVAKVYPRIVDELIPTHMTLGGVQRVLQNLLRERVPLNDLVSILETLLDHAPATKDHEVLTEYVRQALARHIAKQHAGPDGVLYVLSLDPRLEGALVQAMGGEPLPPEAVARLVKGVEAGLDTFQARGARPVVLVSPQVRRFLRRVFEKVLPSVSVLSTSEVPPAVRISSVGVIRHEN